MRQLNSMFYIALIISLSLLFPVSRSYAKERKVNVTVEVNLNAPDDARHVRLWLPYPMSDNNQDVTDVNINGNFSDMKILREGKYGNNALYVEWKEPNQKRSIKYSFNVRRTELVTKEFTKREVPFSKKEFNKYLEPTRLVTTDGKVREYAEKITKGRKGTLAKARAIYDWVAENMKRDPDVRGCGFGEVEKLLETMGGKCVDIHSVFVALMRASGIPAREVMGIRIPQGKEGSMTAAQHCWAEFYLPGYGWVIVDPADVAKARLEKQLTNEQLKPYREYYFGAVDESRVAYGIGRDIMLNPPQSGEPLNYFMYPYAEADGATLNEDLFGYNLGYKITFREL
ncbi:MAG: transglutaminase domain-containing protein [Nitrospirota bacterium]